jgi:rhamnose transport system permease protein
MTKAKRIITIDQTFSWKKFFLQWEWLLVLLFIGINLMNTNLSPYYMNADGLLTATSSFLEKAFIALPMAFILVLGEIDISVASTVALSSVIMGVSYNALGVPMGIAILICLATGTLCGFINGFILTKFKELSPMIVTLGTQILFRGIATMILKDQAAGNFPMWFSEIYWGSVGSIPYMLIVFVVLAIIFGIVLHKTTFGRRVFAMGSNGIASRYTGIKVDKIRLLIYTLTGTMAAVTALFLTSRMGSTRPNIAMGYEMDAIAMVVLGGIPTSGGKGRFIGVIIAIFIVGLLRYGLGLINVSSQVMLIIIGALLISAVMIPNLKLKGLLKKKNG